MTNADKQGIEWFADEIVSMNRKGADFRRKHKEVRPEKRDVRRKHKIRTAWYIGRRMAVHAEDVIQKCFFNKLQNNRSWYAKELSAQRCRAWMVISRDYDSPSKAWSQGVAIKKLEEMV